MNKKLPTTDHGKETLLSKGVTEYGSNGETENFEDKREMALRAGLVASQRLWFTRVNGYGSCEREKKRREDTVTVSNGVKEEQNYVTVYQSVGVWV